MGRTAPDGGRFTRYRGPRAPVHTGGGPGGTAPRPGEHPDGTVRRWEGSAMTQQNGADGRNGADVGHAPTPGWPMGGPDGASGSLDARARAGGTRGWEPERSFYGIGRVRPITVRDGWAVRPMGTNAGAPARMT
jgi:hypothetical protein